MAFRCGSTQAGRTDRPTWWRAYAGRDHSKKPLLLLNHLDVVPVDRKAWKFDPFAAVIQNGEIWGRGTMDMKGIGIQQMMALVTLKKSGITPARDIVMLSTADEENNGTYGIRWMIDNHFSDIDAEYVLDEGGFGTRDILAAGKLVFGIEVGEKQTLWLRVRASGTAAHGSQPIPDNANVTLLYGARESHGAAAGETAPGGGRDDPDDRRAAGGEQVHGRHTGEYGVADDADGGRGVAGEGERDSFDRGSHARLPAAAGRERSGIYFRHEGANQRPARER